MKRGLMEQLSKRKKSLWGLTPLVGFSGLNELFGNQGKNFFRFYAVPVHTKSLDRNHRLRACMRVFLIQACMSTPAHVKGYIRTGLRIMCKFSPSLHQFFNLLHCFAPVYFRVAPSAVTDPDLKKGIQDLPPGFLRISARPWCPDLFLLWLLIYRAMYFSMSCFLISCLFPESFICPASII